MNITLRPARYRPLPTRAQRLAERRADRVLQRAATPVSDSQPPIGLLADFDRLLAVNANWVRISACYSSLPPDHLDRLRRIYYGFEAGLEPFETWMTAHLAANDLERALAPRS